MTQNILRLTFLFLLNPMLYQDETWRNIAVTQWETL